MLSNDGEVNLGSENHVHEVNLAYDGWAPGTIILPTDRTNYARLSDLDELEGRVYFTESWVDDPNNPDNGGELPAGRLIVERAV